MANINFLPAGHFTNQISFMGGVFFFPITPVPLGVYLIKQKRVQPKTDNRKQEAMVTVVIIAKRLIN